MIKLDDITVNDDGTLTIPKNTYEALVVAARTKYNFKGTSVRTLKKYVTKYLEEELSENVVAVPNEFLPKKKES